MGVLMTALTSATAGGGRTASVPSADADTAAKYIEPSAATVPPIGAGVPVTRPADRSNGAAMSSPSRAKTR